jgi:hypothetical protein
MSIKILNLLIAYTCASVFFIESVTAQQYQVKDSFARLIPLKNTFSKIIVSDGITLIYNQSEEEGLAVSARSESFINNLEVMVVGDTLKISLKKYLGKGNFKNEYRVYASSAICNYIVAKYAARVIVLGELAADSVMITASSASKINVDLKVRSLVVNLSEASFAQINGEVKTATIYVNEASRFMGSDLKTNQANIDAKAASKVWLRVIDECKIFAEGASKIYLKGQPVIKEKRLNGASKLLNSN